MQISHQYYYRKGQATAKVVIYSILSVLLVAFAVYCYVHWELSFMFCSQQERVLYSSVRHLPFWAAMPR